MAVNSVGTPNLGSEYANDSGSGSIATVQVGEQNLAQVAQRLGIDSESLLHANPQLADGANIKPGQEIHLPQAASLQIAPQDSQAESDSAPKSDFPAAPLGDPLARIFVQAQLDNKPPMPNASPDILKNARANFMFADADGSGSGSAGTVGTANATAPSTQPVQLQSFKSPDAALKTPSKAEIASLNKELQSGIKGVDDAEKNLKAAQDKAAAYKGADINVIRKNSDEVTKAEKEKDNAYKAMDQDLQDVVRVFGIGRDGATGLSYSPNQEHLGDTSTTASSISRDALKSPPTAASVIMHESNHARRNRELADAGIDRGKFGQKADDIYSALTEMEGDQLEITNQGKLGTQPGFVKGAEDLKKQQIDILRSRGAGDLADLAEQGKFDDALKLFRQRLSVDSHTQKYAYQK